MALYSACLLICQLAIGIQSQNKWGTWIDGDAGLGHCGLNSCSGIILVMRPDHLNSYFASLTSIKGVGPKLAQAFARLLRGDVLQDVRRIDLLLHMPVAVIDRSLQTSLATAPEGAIVTVLVTIDKHLPPPRGNRRVPYRVLAHDETDELTLTYFHAKGGYLEKQMPVGSTRYVSGRLERFNGAPQITHPDHVVDETDFASLPLLEPVYPLTAGLSGKVLHKTVLASLDDLANLPEWQDGALLTREGWAGFEDALRRVHMPINVSDLEPVSPHRRRLAYDECLANQLALSLVRNNVKKAAGIARRWDGRLKQALIEALPFTLTDSQQTAIADIEADLALARDACSDLFKVMWGAVRPWLLSSRRPMLSSPGLRPL